MSLSNLKGILDNPRENVVQEMLGHSNYSTTTGIYSHMGPDIHKEASKQMNVDLSLAEMNTKELVKKCQKDLVQLNYQVFPCEKHIGYYRGHPQQSLMR